MKIQLRVPLEHYREAPGDGGGGWPEAQGDTGHRRPPGTMDCRGPAECAHGAFNLLSGQGTIYHILVLRATIRYAMAWPMSRFGEFARLAALSISVVC